MPEKSDKAPQHRTARLVLQLTPDEKNKLREVAAKDRRDLAFVVREALHKAYPWIAEN